MTLREWIELDADRFEPRAVLEAYETYLLETAAMMALAAGHPTGGAQAILDANAEPLFFRVAFDLIRVMREGES